MFMRFQEVCETSWGQVHPVLWSFVACLVVFLHYAVGHHLYRGRDGRNLMGTCSASYR